MRNLENWDKLARPPETALKQIKGGRLSGMTDINPQWRYKAMTEVYGPCGVGWSYEVVRTWTESGPDGQVCAFAQVNLTIGQHAPIPGVGGSMLVAKESSGLRTSDEAYKMAITDALSVAMKMLGVGADIYMGLWDGSKYKEPSSGVQGKGTITPNGDALNNVSADELIVAEEAAAYIVEAVGDEDWERAYDQFIYITKDYKAEHGEAVPLAMWALLQPHSKIRNTLKAMKKERETMRQAA